MASPERVSSVVDNHFFIICTYGFMHTGYGLAGDNTVLRSIKDDRVRNLIWERSHPTPSSTHIGHTDELGRIHGKRWAPKFVSYSSRCIRNRSKQNLPRQKDTKTYNSGYSLVVTDPTTNPPIWSLCMAERTGCPVLSSLWSYVLGIRLIVTLFEIGRRTDGYTKPHMRHSQI
jgi:hypothetical protein